MKENPYRDDDNTGIANKMTKHNELDDSPKVIKEGELMRKSAQNLPSLVSIRHENNKDYQCGNRDSQISNNRGSVFGNDSMMSLFQQINQKAGGQSAYA